MDESKSIDVIAFFGEQGSGKSTLSNSLVSEGFLTSARKFSFADTLYECMSLVLSRDARSVDKNEPLEALGGNTLRFAMQTLGTEWGRDTIADSLWCNSLLNKVESYLTAKKGDGVAVIDDLRFTNEYDALRESDYNVIFVRVDREGLTPEQSSNHASEADWRDFEADVIVDNKFALEDTLEGIVYSLRLDKSFRS